MQDYRNRPPGDAQRDRHPAQNRARARHINVKNYHSNYSVLREIIDINTWARKQHYELFKSYKDPFYGIVVNVDVTHTYHHAKAANHSFFLSYLFKSIKAVNATEAFRLRIEDNQLVKYDAINASAVINRVHDGFGFSLIDYHSDFNKFCLIAQAEIERVQASTELFPPTNPNNVVHFSSLPWLQFTSLSHAQPLAGTDSVPKISFGKVFDQGDRKMMPYSIHVHHALVDGIDIAVHVEHYQRELDMI